MSSASSAGSKRSLLRRFFSLRRSESQTTIEEEPAKPSQPEVDVFAQIMALNARHGHPSVQADMFKVRPVEKKKSKTSRTKKQTRSQMDTIPSGPPPAYDAFDAIMKLNAKHGHPSVQAAFVR